MNVEKEGTSQLLLDVNQIKDNLLQKYRKKV